MRAHRLTDGRPDLRAGLLLLVCVLALGLATAGTGGTGHGHAHRNAAVLTASTSDTQHVAARQDTPAMLTTSGEVRPVSRGPAGTSDSSSTVISRTAQTPPVRGPPGEAAA